MMYIKLHYSYCVKPSVQLDGAVLAVTLFMSNRTPVRSMSTHRHHRRSARSGGYERASSGLFRERCGTHRLRFVRTIRFCSRCYQHAIELDHVRRLPHRNQLSGDLCLCRGRTVLAGAFSSEVDAGSRQENAIAQEVIPILTDQNSRAQARSPIDMMRQGRSMRVFQASQRWSRMSA